jgi:hypothetical protein
VKPVVVAVNNFMFPALYHTAMLFPSEYCIIDEAKNQYPPCFSSQFTAHTVSPRFAARPTARIRISSTVRRSMGLS